MANRAAPSTPVATTAQTLQSNDPTGNWRHPRFDEISKRLETSTFSEKNIKRILWRMGALAAYFGSHKVNAILKSQLGVDLLALLWSLLPFVLRHFVYPILPILLFIYALLPLRPLFLTRDDLTDIPLTPKQRALLGLKPSFQPETPGSHYITPPRYSRSGTPRSSSSSQSSGSAFSGKGSPLGTNAPPSSYSPVTSPLFQRAVSRDAARRLSFGSPSPLNLNRTTVDAGNSMLSLPASPLTGKGASVGLNNRWLYEKGSRSSSGLKMYS